MEKVRYRCYRILAAVGLVGLLAVGLALTPWSSIRLRRLAAEYEEKYSLPNDILAEIVVYGEEAVPYLEHLVDVTDSLDPYYWLFGIEGDEADSAIARLYVRLFSSDESLKVCYQDQLPPRLSRLQTRLGPTWEPITERDPLLWGMILQEYEAAGTTPHWRSLLVSLKSICLIREKHLRDEMLRKWIAQWPDKAHLDVIWLATADCKLAASFIRDSTLPEKERASLILLILTTDSRDGQQPGDYDHMAPIIGGDIQEYLDFYRTLGEGELLESATEKFTKWLEESPHMFTLERLEDETYVLFRPAEDPF